MGRPPAAEAVPGLPAVTVPAAGRAPEPGFGLEAFEGRLGEISGERDGAGMTAVFRLVLECQRRGEPAAWVARFDSIFFPPDAAETGVDLAALPVVWARDALTAARAADLLVRSGAFGLVVLDLQPGAELPLHAQTRLVGLALQHGTAVVGLTEKDEAAPSIGSLVAVRAHTARRRGEGDRFRCEVRIVKDKRRGPGRGHEEVCRGPDGVC